MTTKNPVFPHLATILVSTLLIFASCVNSVDEDDDNNPNTPPPTAEARINTRTDAAGVPPVYPVRIYAFDATGSCAANQTITTADDDIALPLSAEADAKITATGTYNLRPVITINM